LPTPYGSSPPATATTADPAIRPDTTGDGLAADLRELALVLALPVGYALAAPVLGIHVSYDPAITVGAPVVVAILVGAVLSAWHLRPRRGTGGRWVFSAPETTPARAVIGRLYRTRRRWLRGYVLLVAAVTFLDVYASYKQAIPRFGAYTWDPLLSELDRLVHGGAYPWELLGALVENRWALVALDRVYWAWGAVSIAVLILGSFAPARKQRVQFMLSYYMAWIIGGTLLAIAFASGGPVYFAHFVPDAFNPYEPLVTTVQGTEGLASVWMQNALLVGFTEGGHVRASGISAMPSMHVAMSTLCALLAYRIHRGLGMVTAAYAACIAVGSVVLAWHYAIDAYASVGLALLLWWTAGRIADRLEKGPLAPRVPGRSRRAGTMASK
jgi:hypothetical protein